MLKKLFRGKRKKREDEAIDDNFCLSLTDDAFVTNPYIFFTFLRHNQPLHRSQTGAWVLTAYDDINVALKDDRLGNAPSPYSILHPKNADKYYVASVANNIIPFIDGSMHKQLRQPIAQTFAKQLNETLPLVADLAKKYCQKLDQETTFDVIADFGTPFSIAVMIEFLGLKEGDNRKLKNWSQDLIYLFGFIPSEEARVRIDEHLKQFRDFCLASINEKKLSPANDWLSKIIQQRDTENLQSVLTDTVIADNAMLIFADGIENIDRGIGTAVSLLMQHPQQSRPLLENDDKKAWRAAVNEVLRFESPAQFVGRVVKEDINLYGQTIKKDQIILLMLASANRDESIFENPDDFDIKRKIPFYMSFGRGKHACLGGDLARQEIQIATRLLLLHFPNLKLSDKSLGWDLRIGHRWLKQVVVKV